MSCLGGAPMLPFDWDPDGGQHESDGPVAVPEERSAVGTVGLQTSTLPAAVEVADARATVAAGAGGWVPASPPGAHAARPGVAAAAGAESGPVADPRSSIADHVARLLARAPRLTDRQKMDLRRMLGPPARWGT